MAYHHALIRNMSISKEIKEHVWEYYGAAAIPLYISIYPPLYTQGFNVRYGLPVDILYVSEKKRAHWFMRADQLSALAEKILPVILKQQWGWYQQCVDELAVFQKFNRRFLKIELTTLSDKEVWNLMREYREQFFPPFVTNNVIEPISYYFQHHLKDLLVMENIAPDHATQLIELYGQAARPSYLKLCAEEYRNATSDTDREAVREKYYYIFNDYLGEKKVTHDDLAKIVASTPLLVAEEFRTGKITIHAQALLTVMQVVATMQDVRKAELLEMVSAAKRFGLEYARRKNIPYEDVEWATWYEVEEDSFDITLARTRRETFTMLWTTQGLEVIQGEDAKPFLQEARELLLKVQPDIHEVKGVCASKGISRGRVVIVFDPSEFNRVKDGDILMTVMTRPEFLPVMHKAAAFVCDEGGLTSHAAIVAREMHKPCIVGTRTGTRVFKEGDMVEVDANSGIVRKL